MNILSMNLYGSRNEFFRVETLILFKHRLLDRNIPVTTPSPHPTTPLQPNHQLSKELCSGTTFKHYDLEVTLTILSALENIKINNYAVEWSKRFRELKRDNILPSQSPKEDSACSESARLIL